MKIRFCLLVFTVLFFASCQLTENVYVNEDGSGKYSLDIDASGVMAMAGDEMSAEKDIDSSFAFKDLLAAKKDSISKLPAEEQARLKKLEKVSMKIKSSAAEKQFIFSMFMDYKNADELVDLMQAVNAIKPPKQPGEEDNPLSKIGNGENTNLKFSYDGKSFKRKVTVKDKALLAAAKDTTGMSAMMFAGSSYTLKYHFPRKVKSVSNPTATFSDDRKTVTVQYPFTDYMDDPEKMSLEVVLDKK